MDFNSVMTFITEIFTNASILALIIVASVQLLKIIFNKIGLSKLKSKHKQIYTLIYTLLTIALIGVGIYINTVYYLELIFDFSNVEFLITFVSTSTATTALTYLMYNGVYEGIGIKSLVGFIWKTLKNSAISKPTTKFAKFINALSNEKILEITSILPDTSEELDLVIEEVKELPKEIKKIIVEEAKDNLRIM